MNPIQKLKTRPFDPAERLRDKEDIAAYLQLVIEEGDPEELPQALGVIARAHGMSQLARDTGLAREGLYRALSPNGNPEFSTVMKVTRALGLRLAVALA